MYFYTAPLVSCPAKDQSVIRSVPTWLRSHFPLKTFSTTLVSRSALVCQGFPTVTGTWGLPPGSQLRVPNFSHEPGLCSWVPLGGPCQHSSEMGVEAATLLGWGVAAAHPLLSSVTLSMKSARGHLSHLSWAPRAASGTATLPHESHSPFPLQARGCTGVGWGGDLVPQPSSQI